MQRLENEDHQEVCPGQHDEATTFQADNTIILPPVKRVDCRYKCWFGTTVTLIVFGTLLLFINTGIALYCLNEYGFSTAVCDIESSILPAIDTLRSIVEIIEPIMSVLVVISVLVYTEYPTLRSIKCCTCQILRSIRYLCKHFWFMSYMSMLSISICYHIFVFISNVVNSHWEGALRYITLPMGLTAWFVWLVVLNERGAMTTVARDNLQASTRVINGETNSMPRDPPGLSKLYKTLLIFAGSTNFIEFLLYTIYLTGSFATIPATERNRLLWYFDFLSMSVTTALRFSFASFFFQMLYIGEKKYKQMTDPWHEKRQDFNANQELSELT